MAKLLFGFKIKYTELIMFEDSGNGIFIYDDGTVAYNHYHDERGDHGNIAYMVVKKADKGTVDEIKEILARYKEDVAALPKMVNNRSCDGSWWYFYIDRREIVVDNPKRYDEAEILRYMGELSTRLNGWDPRLPYYNNTLMNLLEEIAEVLEKQGLQLLWGSIENADELREEIDWYINHRDELV